MTLIFICITLVYSIIIGSLIFGFDKVKSFSPERYDVKTTFSVVIPFKNEAENLYELLESIFKLNYPKNLYEVILVNDDSEDDSVGIIQSFLTKRPFDCAQGDIIILDNDRKTNSPKKDALTTAIKQAKFDWIVTTDADCIVPENWLANFDGYIQNKKPKLIVAPVTYHKVNSFLKRFQLLDALSLQGATIGGFGINKPFLCNGANITYKKELFFELKGFEGNTNIASGDDIFLLEKAVKHCLERIHYLKSKNAIVLTKPQPNLNQLIAQRIRWAAKTSSYNNGFGKLTGLAVLIMNASVICSLICAFFQIISLKLFGYIFVIKFSVDFLLIYKASRLFNQENVLSSFVLSSLIYPFFSVYVALVSVFKGYKWKGIRYKK